ncbi:MAG: DUF2442 domain-containing protein [Opitutaceae bacterium]|jgi:hypothetical protein
MIAEDKNLIAVEVRIEEDQVWLRLLDGATHTFPIAFYPRLAFATAEQLAEVKLRVGGRALRWDILDEDIWVTDAVIGNYPKIQSSQSLCVNDTHPEAES